MNNPTYWKSLFDFCCQHLTAREALLLRRLGPLQCRQMPSTVFRIASRLGDGPLWGATGAALLAFGGPRERLAVAAAAAAVVLSVIIFMAVKNVLRRPRPFEVWRDLACLMPPPDKFSFPSGHTMTAFAVHGALSSLIPELGPLFLPFALLIGFSRVFLGCHYPSDVLVGGLIGFAIGRAAAAMTVWVG